MNVETIIMCGAVGYHAVLFSFSETGFYFPEEAKQLFPRLAF